MRDAAAAAATLSVGLVADAEPTTEGKPIEPGLQLYTVRDLLASDFPGTLAAVAEIDTTSQPLETARAGFAYLENARKQ